MRIVDVLFGRPLASYEDQKEKIGGAEGIPIFGLDALGSAAYGPEAALTLLIPLVGWARISRTFEPHLSVHFQVTRLRYYAWAEERRGA
jgi:hypothetical protein